MSNQASLRRLLRALLQAKGLGLRAALLQPQTHDSSQTYQVGSLSRADLL